MDQDEYDDLRSRLASLTHTERTVQRLAVWGVEMRYAAELLGLSLSAVHLHRTRVLTKLRARNFAHAATLIARIQTEEEWDEDRRAAQEVTQAYVDRRRG